MSVDPALGNPSVKGNNPSKMPLNCPPNYPPQGCPPQGCPGQSRPIEVTIVQPQVVYGPQQMAVVCQCCGAQVVTETTYHYGLFTWLLSFILFIFGCVAGCCLIPFCIKDTKDVVHSCPNCQREIGRWKRI